MKTALQRLIEDIEGRIKLLNDNDNLDHNFKLGLKHAVKFAKKYLDLEEWIIKKSFAAGEKSKGIKSNSDKFFKETFEK
jgi:hypothetical protein